MNRSLTRTLSLSLVGMAGCVGIPPAEPDGPLAAQVTASANLHGVPRDLVLAIAHIEGGLRLPQMRMVRGDDDVPVAGILELRHGAFDSLARGAILVGSDENTLRADTDLGTEAGVRVVAELGVKWGASLDNLSSWRSTVEELSGLSDSRYRDQYVVDIFSLLRTGGDLPAREGETVHLAPHPELDDATIGVIRQALGDPPPDFPGALWFSTDCTNKCTAGRPDGNGSVDAIAIHDTEGGWVGSVATLQNDPGKSVHYIVDADGSRVGQFLHETDTAWHVGNWCWNKHSIGIEHVGVASDPSGYSAALYDKSVELVKNIRTRWTVPLDRAHIVGHDQIPNGTLIDECSPACADTLTACETGADWGGSDNHRDPGFYWQWCQYFQKLGGHCDCNDAWPLWNCTTDKTEAVRCENGKVEIEACAPCESQPNGVNDICHAPPMPDLGGAPRPDDLGTRMGERDLALAVASPIDLAGAIPSRSDGGASSMDAGCHCDLGRRSASGTSAVVWLVAGAILFARRRRRPI